jgi:RNA-directed DNA polymerase
LKLIRAFLNAGVMEDGLVSPSAEGTPQGGPLSPLLSNLVLDELDRELERRGHRFARYADDCNIYVRSERAGQRVMESITRFITRKLKLKVNEAKSAVARPQERKFLGFSFTAGPGIKRTIAPKSLDRFKRRIREITRRAKGVSIKTIMEELASYMQGWRGYYGFCETPEVLIALTRWVRLRLRAALWRQWKTPRRRRAALVALGVVGELRNVAGSGHVHGISLAASPLCGALQCLLQIARPSSLGRHTLATLLEPPYTDPYVRWCGRGGVVRLPPIPIRGPYRKSRERSLPCRNWAAKT